jgi:membrane-associated phospholipid phosphatase
MINGPRSTNASITSTAHRAAVWPVCPERRRPPLHRLDQVTGHSFPSRPPQFAALVAGGLLVACVAFSRVYLGVHYPSDVVAAAMLGAGWSAVATRLGHLWNSADERSELPVGAQGAAWAR